MSGNVATFKSQVDVMGNQNSRIKCGQKKKKKPWRKLKKSDIEDEDCDDCGFDNIFRPENDFEIHELNAMKKLVKEKPSVFVLNNLLMSIQLFSNYEKEIERAREEVKARENEMNKKLLPEKMILLPDVLREHFDGRLRFTSYCKSDKNEQTVEPLRPVQMYLVYENVLVNEHEESRHYSTTGELNVDYNFILKEAGNKGYVRLENLNESKKRSTTSDITDLSLIVENNNEIVSEDESVYGPINKRMSGHVGASSMPNLLDDEIYYEEQNSGSSQDLQNRLNVPQNINSRISRPYRKGHSSSSNGINPDSASSSSSNYNLDSDSDYSSYHSSRRTRSSSCGRSSPTTESIDANEIPYQCFKRITYMYNGRVYNPKKEQKPLTSQQKRIRDEKLTHNYDIVYVDGYRFAKHFYKIFMMNLAKKMEFDEKVVKNAKRNDAIIRLEKIDYLSAKNYTSIEQYEVIPCFASPWPRWARKWLDRPRYGWPSDEALLNLERSQCYLVPESPKQVGTNLHPLWRLDWSLNFPSAERYLETCLSSSQMTVYAIALMLHKTFIRTVSSTFGLDTRHIRNMIFWMAERQPQWSEHEMGKSMIILLESLHNHIQHRAMQDYFMQNRNLFSNVHLDELLHSQKQLKRIIENPVMFIFHAMEKIHYEHEDYPRLDYKELLRLLTINELLLINPMLEAKAQEEVDESAFQNYGKRQYEKSKFWSEAKQTTQHYKQNRRRSNNTIINPKQMFDSIIDIPEKCEDLTTARLSKLLLFFSEHFIRMARCSHEFGASHQKYVYLNQSRLLALLLAENPDQKFIAKHILEEVKKLRDDSIPINIEGNNGAPETPRRNSDPPIFSMSLRDRYAQPSSLIERNHIYLNNNNDHGNRNRNKNSVEVEVSVHAMDVIVPKFTLNIPSSERCSSETIVGEDSLNSPETTSF